MEYKDKVAIVTGGAHGIGKCIAEELRQRGASVAVIDVREGDHFVGAISKNEVLEASACEVIRQHGLQAAAPHLRHRTPYKQCLSILAKWS